MTGEVGETHNYSICEDHVASPGELFLTISSRTETKSNLNSSHLPTDASNAHYGEWLDLRFLLPFSFIFLCLFVFAARHAN